MITKRVQYRYDSVRNKIGMTDADGGLHTYTYDVMRRLTGVINPLGERTTYAYDLNGRRTSVQLANGTRTSYVYDVASRVQSVHTLKSDDSTVSKFEYAYDGNGRRTSALEADGSRVTWTYDSISQVTSEWRTGTNPYRHTFTYDKCGNRTLKVEDGARTTLVYDAANQLVTSEDAGGTTTFTYDGNGNQTVVQKPSGDRTTQVWDYENRLVKTIQPSGGVTSMVYDVDGLRLKKEDATGTKLFVWDDQNYLAETDATGTTETAFTTESSTYGSLISHRKAGDSTFYHFDALGSTRALTDANEAVLESYNYGAFGTLLGSPTLLTPFLWGGMVGYYWDSALASQYIRARHYQPTTGRWTSQDPIGFAGGNNLYGAYFVPNDTDPSGTDLFDIHDCGPVTKPKGIPSGSHCTWLTWLGTGNSVCCTANQIDAGEACCKKRGKNRRLSTCTHYPLNCGSKLLDNADLFVCRDATREECEEDCYRDKINVCDPQCRRIPERHRNKRRICWENCIVEYSRCIHDCP